MSDFGLVVIGAHFGVWLKEDIEKYKNKNILLVEPVPYNYEILEKEFVEKDNIFICKNAILDEIKTDDFYYVKKNSINKLKKHWASQIGSFNKSHILNHKSKRFEITEDDIESKRIEFITFNHLINKYSIDSIEKLQIDVEGAEYKIMKDIDYDKINIKSIIFESKHFDGTFTEGEKLKEIKDKLVSAGYNLKQIDKENILAVK